MAKKVTILNMKLYMWLRIFTALFMILPPFNYIIQQNYKDWYLFVCQICKKNVDKHWVKTQCFLWTFNSVG